MRTLTITVADSANCPGGAAPQKFQVLSQTWTGAEVPWGKITDFAFIGELWAVTRGRNLSSSHLWLAHPHSVVGWQGNPGECAPVHVAQVVALPADKEAAAGPLPRLLLCYGGDAGVRLLDDTTPTAEGLPPGQGHPYLTLPASAITALPAEVQAVVRQRLCAWCGEKAGEEELCDRCARQASRYQQIPGDTPADRLHYVFVDELATPPPESARPPADESPESH